MIEVCPISNAATIGATAFALEVATFLNGEMREEDIPWDDDPLIEWYIANVVASEDKDAYLEERRVAEDEARGAVRVLLIQEISERKRLL